MFIEAQKLIGLAVASEEDREKIGTISEIVVEPENGRILGFLVKSGGMFSGIKALSIVDIKDWDPNGIVTRTIDNLVEPKEIIRLYEVLDKKINILGMRARTESGKNLGQVENYLLDTETEMVVKYYLKDLLGKSRIFSSDKVVSISNEIIFSDDVAEVPPSAAGAVA